ncbi:M48 family metallopeptidase [Robiginitalea sp. M366]|uniref:M48 family metallopeptidase n=1 Tax=Robiginitalea aestuariiviva TaxID=3036903 RepID=UPI00240D92AA|nr:M48 family metallopeptidase [Robiginitalea aestuariiviva]MDG1573230.1 M48 family metallopeptidase [Robiginitalea aestuariiviva]
MSAESLTYIITGILLVQYAVETLLEYLNARRFNATPPKEVEGLYDPEEYQRSQAYKKANYRFGLLSGALSTFGLVAFLLLGGFGWADQLAASVSDDPLIQAILFFGILYLGADLLSTPLGLYHTFVIEARFGFNKTTPALYWADKAKGWALALVLGGGLLTAIMAFYQWAGTAFWLYAWGLITLFSVLMNLWYSRLIVPLFNRQEPLEDGPLKEKIEQYARQVGFELQKIFVIDGSRRSTKANAYFSGFGSQKRVTLYDTLIRDLEADEVVAVLAHEVGHYRRRHILINLLASTALTGLTLFVLSVFINHPELSRALGVQNPSFHAALLSFGLLYSPISEATGLIMNIFSRRFEFQADAYARDTFAAEPLIRSLKKLSRNHLSNLTPHPAYVFMHYSHPPLAARIAHLRHPAPD